MNPIDNLAKLKLGKGTKKKFGLIAKKNKNKIKINQNYSHLRRTSKSRTKNEGSNDPSMEEFIDRNSEGTYLAKNKLQRFANNFIQTEKFSTPSLYYKYILEIVVKSSWSGGRISGVTEVEIYDS